MTIAHPTPPPTLPDQSRPYLPSAGDNIGMRAVTRSTLTALALLLALSTPALAIDPPYQRQMERLAEIMGSLSFLQPLCDTSSQDWRTEMADLIALDQPDEDRRQRLAGAFNAGHTAYARFHRACTPAARTALTRLLQEAERTARDIHTRFAE